ncbi:uncharacterized protein EI90DRAFT_3124294 [Cantharellus anzutake]|uniref:uncharacterized protein n=1 Tax=Cantharellus anzutake TaxID=1750568 RepID=UPI001904832F|nr:uncharacterized protein EI90DRAFT_3124294 [Cantharellus anzutake]KAF8330595.1 hypothetical protein EI90DRAFT_3124294 [Cantharellus anzutake]
MSWHLAAAEVLPIPSKTDGKSLRLPHSKALGGLVQSHSAALEEWLFCPTLGGSEVSEWLSSIQLLGHLVSWHLTAAENPSIGFEDDSEHVICLIPVSGKEEEQVCAGWQGILKEKEGGKKDGLGRRKQEWEAHGEPQSWKSFAFQQGVAHHKCHSHEAIVISIPTPPHLCSTPPQLWSTSSLSYPHTSTIPSSPPPPPISSTFSGTSYPHLKRLLVFLPTQYYYGPPWTSTMPAKVFPLSSSCH